MNYPKPRLYIHNGQIIKQNVPVPRLGFLVKYLSRYEPAIARLNVILLMHYFLEKLKNNASQVERTLSLIATKKLTLSIICTLNSFNKEYDRTVLLVHLPSMGDYKNSPESDSLRTYLRINAKINGWFYIDLIDDFRNLSSGFVPELFIKKNIPGFIGSKGHYTEKGNRYIADLLVKKIVSNPSIIHVLRKKK